MMERQVAFARPPTSSTDPAPSWRRLVHPDAPPSGAARHRRPASARRILAQFVAANVVAMLLLVAGSVWAGRQAAEGESIANAASTTDLVAELLVKPALTDGVLLGDPTAIAALDDVVRGRVVAASILRVKLWAPDGRIVYSDESRLIGEVYSLGEEERQALRDGRTYAELSTLAQPENVYERSQGQLLEVYRRISTPSGDPVLFETYIRYDAVTARQSDIWLAFLPISVSVLLLALLMQLPLGRRMIRQLHDGETLRLALQARAADASTDERRRIAGSLHDGIVQDLAAANFVVSGAVDQLTTRFSSDARTRETTESLADAGTAIRESVASLRSLLVEIYPPHLAQAGLPAALTNLVTRLQPRGVRADVDVPDDLDVSPDTAALVFRIAQEALLNVAKHARARVVRLAVWTEPRAVILEVSDDGVGFDLDDQDLRKPPNRHFGLRVLSDLAAAAGATLDVATAPGRGTRLRLLVPQP